MGGRVVFVAGWLLSAALLVLTLGCSAGLTIGLRDKIALEDPGAPILPTDSQVSIDRALNEALEVSWQPATDVVSSPAELEYLVVYAQAEADVTGALALEATVAQAWTAGVTEGVVSGLTFETGYWVGVAVRDRAGNTAYYTPALGTTANDTVAPVPGGDLQATDVGMESITITWSAATDPDDLTPQAELEYLVVYSDSASIDTVDAALANGTVAMSWTTDVTTYPVTGLVDDRSYDINVLVRDSVLNTEHYGVITVPTEKHPRIFITDLTAPSILRADTDGAPLEAIVQTGLTAPTAVAVDPVERRIYWVDSTTDTLKRALFDGTDVQTLITGLSASYGIAVDWSSGGRLLYWTDYTANTLYRSGLVPATTDPADHVLLDAGDGVSQPRGIDVDEDTGDFYWVEVGASPRIRMAARATPGSPQIVVDATYVPPPTYDPYFPSDIAVDWVNGVIYWTDVGDTGDFNPPARLYSKALGDGTTIQELITSGLSIPAGVSVEFDVDPLDPTATVVYWADRGTARIYRAPDFTGGGAAATYVMSPTSIGAPVGLQVY